MPVSTNSAVPAASHKKQSNRKLFILLGVAPVAIITLLVFAASRNFFFNDTATTEKAVVKTITHLVTATGKVQPEVEVKTSPEVAGELIEIPVVEGQAVKKGDLLTAVENNLVNLVPRVGSSWAGFRRPSGASLRSPHSTNDQVLLRSSALRSIPWNTGIHQPTPDTRH